MESPTVALPAGVTLPRRPTRGPECLSQAVVPTTLLDELSALDSKFARREADLQEQRIQLERERERFERAVAAREWAMQKDRHSLDVQMESLTVSASEAGAVAADQATQLVVVAGGEPISTTLGTLVAREPLSGLSAGARALFASHDTRSAEGAPAKIPRLYIDREPVVTFHLIEWLRDGRIALERVPKSVLHLLQVEAAHWKMSTLELQLEELLGKQDASGEGLQDLDWILGQLELHQSKRPALCRAAADQLRRWLARSRDRRRLACRKYGLNLTHALVGAMEGNRSDLPLLTAGLGCCVLFGSEPEGRKLLAAARKRLTPLAADARVIASTCMMEVSGPEFEALAANEAIAEATEQAAARDAEREAEAAVAKLEARREAHKTRATYAQQKVAPAIEAEQKAVEAAMAADIAEAAEVAAEAAATADSPEAWSRYAEAAGSAEAAAEAAAAAAAAAEGIPEPEGGTEQDHATDASEPEPSEPAAAIQAAIQAVEQNDGPASAEDPAEGERKAAEALALALDKAEAKRTAATEGLETSNTMEREMFAEPSADAETAALAAPGRSTMPEDEIAPHRARSLAASALSVRERRELATKLDRELDKLQRVLELC